ncbi:MAG: zeta toxin family protein [Planctomycetes bacterium]|nr:zeta toxin family protein [Planctomycetota bacterium]
MASKQPVIVVIGCPNGAGKSSIAMKVLQSIFDIHEYVNADSIAVGLAGTPSDEVAIAAGRVMLARIRELATAKESFGFESTLASKTFAPWLRECKGRGYKVHIVYVALASPELALQRVAARVAVGGHSIPNDVVVRRFSRSARNFMELYMPLADAWHIFDNSGNAPVLAAYQMGGLVRVLRSETWNTIFKHAQV